MEPGLIMGIDTAETSAFLKVAARRMSFWGSTIVGILGIVLAINAGFSDEFIGAGVCLAGSALAFGVLGYTFVRR